MSEQPYLLICMGVAGSGKTTLARALAERFAFVMLDADDFLPAAHKLKLGAGAALEGHAHERWMQSICRRLEQLALAGRSCALAHSALLREDRDRLRDQEFNVSFLNLLARRSVLCERLADRRPPYLRGKVLTSQLEAMQSPLVEADVFPMDATLTPRALMERAAPLVEQQHQPRPQLHAQGVPTASLV